MADILAVDDEKEWRDLYAETLTELGHRVRTSHDGKDALRQIRQDLPDLVILDIRMAPSGRQVLGHIRRKWPRLPVVISSLYGGYRHDPDFARVAAFLDKSPDLAPLVETIGHILGSPGAVQRTGGHE